MKLRALFIILVLSYVLVMFPFSGHMKSKPFAEKIGYLPRHEILTFVAADQAYLLANLLVMKSLFYFGSLVEIGAAELILPADYEGIYRTIDAAVKMDPYNQDAYYFVQAAMSWDKERVKLANSLLEYGMTKRDWDYQLPFYLGFNYAFFLQDYEKAAYNYSKAAELTGDALFANLAGRFMYESRRTDLALSYIKTMEQQATSDAIKKSFQTRIKAFEAVKLLELANASYREDFEVDVPALSVLVDRGYLEEIPADPYGGKFYIDSEGHIRSTSKFAYAGVNGEEGSQSNERN